MDQLIKGTTGILINGELNYKLFKESGQTKSGVYITANQIYQVKNLNQMQDDDYDEK